MSQTNCTITEDIVMYSDGSSKRCFTYITDAIAWVLNNYVKGEKW